MNQPVGFRFGVFELDLAGGELRKNGQRLHIQEKPFQTLALLLERAGEAVTREELRERLWPSDTFVEFDDNLNSTVKRVREALGDTADRPRYIQTIPKRGYRFIPPVEVIYPAAVVVAPTPQPRWWWIAAALFLLAALGLTYYSLNSQPAGKIMLAVLPFRNLSGDAGQDYLSDGVTEELIAHLGRLSPSKLGVISVTSVMRFKNTTEDVAAIGKQLGVRYILEGSVRKMDGHIESTSQLIQVSDRTHLWAETYGPSAGGLAVVQQAVAEGVAKALAIRLLPSETAALARAATTNTAAYDAYLAGTYEWNRGTKESFGNALKEFERAATLDPNYALAHAGMAKCYLELGDYRLIPPAEAVAKARVEVDQAMQLDDTIPESHALAAAVLDQSNANAAGVDEGYRRAIALNPSDARVRRMYAVYPLHGNRLDQAAPQAAEAVRLDPLSASSHTYAGWIYYSNASFKRAWEESRRAIELDAHLPFALYLQGHLYEHERRYDDAIGQYQKAVDSSGRTPKYLYALAGAYLAAGKREPAQRILGELQQQAKSSFVPPEYLQKLSQKLAGS